MARSNIYTNEQIECLKRNYPNSNYDEIFKMFPDKSKRQIKAIAYAHNIKNNNPCHRKNILGGRYGKLVVVAFKGVNNHKSMWECVCDCGKTDIIVAGKDLTSGNTKSCGCLNRTAKGKNYVGQRFGMLKAIERLPNYMEKISPSSW